MNDSDSVIADPVIALSHNFTYYAPEEVFCMPLAEPTAVTFGSALQAGVDLALPAIHIHLAERVEDRLELNAEMVVEKRVRVAAVHGALLYRDQRLSYLHLGDEPSVIAEPRRDAIIITRRHQTVPMSIGKTVGLGMTTDGFGQIMWWYYFRIYSLAWLRQQAGKRSPFGR